MGDATTFLKCHLPLKTAMLGVGASVMGGYQEQPSKPGCRVRPVYVVLFCTGKSF